MKDGVRVKKQDFRVRVGAHSGSVLSLYLFAVLMNKVIKKIQEEVL